MREIVLSLRAVRRARMPWLIGLLTMLLSTFTLSAAEVIIFGPEKFATDTGKPALHSREFAIDLSDDCDGLAHYVITVESGDQTGASIASGEVSLNGRTLLKDSDFHKKTMVLTREVRALANNSLRVSVNGPSRGAFLRVTVSRVIERDLFEPRELLLTSKQAAFSQRFPGTSGQAVLVVENGAADGNPVKGGSLVLNGTALAGDRELSMPGLRIPVNLIADNTLDIELRGTVGDKFRVSVREVLDPSACARLSIAFTEPADGASIHGRSVLTRGTATGTADLGITVNGTVADIDLDHRGTDADPFVWTATTHPADGPAVLTATAVSGPSTATATRGITFATDPNEGELKAYPTSGLAPLRVQFMVPDDVAATSVSYRVDYDGDGVDDAVLAPNAPLSFTYANSGTFQPRVTAVDSSGATRVLRAYVVSDSLAALDKVIQARWRAFTSALAAGDVDRAVSSFVSDPARRDLYRGSLNRIRPGLSTLATDIAVIEPLEVVGGVAKYLLTRTIDGRLKGYHVYLIRDRDGVWRIVQF